MMVHCFASNDRKQPNSNVTSFFGKRWHSEIVIYLGNLQISKNGKINFSARRKIGMFQTGEQKEVSKSRAWLVETDEHGDAFIQDIFGSISHDRSLFILGLGITVTITELSSHFLIPPLLC